MMPDQDKYRSERYKPALNQCGTLSLRFDGRSRALLSAGSVFRKYRAVSDRADSQGAFDYSARRQHQATQGPIPEGTYWIRPDELWENTWYKPAPRAAWGIFD
jgi:hypothetical protein